MKFMKFIGFIEKNPVLFLLRNILSRVKLVGRWILKPVSFLRHRYAECAVSMI